MSRHDRPPSRRGHTRRLLLVPLAGLVVLVGGVVTLEAAAPQLDPEAVEAFAFEQLPTPGLDDVVVCTRSVLEEATTTELRGDFQPLDRVTSEQVYACPAVWDDLEVTYVGEVVGELLPRDGGVWAQINDDDYALETGPLVGHRERSGFNSGLAVWLPDGLHERVDGFGRPAQRGTVVRLEGTVLRADPADGGGTTLRAQTLEVLAPATTIEPPLHTLQLVVAIVLAVTAAGALVYARQARRR